MPDIPQWQSTLILAVVLILTAEIAYRISRYVASRHPEAKGSSEGASLMLSAALALLGLLIGFTFSMASDRYDARRMWVNEEANAIGTAYLRSRLAVGPDQTTLPTLWSTYAETRYALKAAQPPAQQLALLDKADGLQARIWAATRRESIAAPNDITASLIDATNNAFDVAASRRTAVEAVVPSSIIWSVILYSVAAAAILGYALTADSRRLLLSSVLLGLVALSIGLILALNRPSHVVRVSQAPMTRVIKTIRTMQAADRVTPPAPAPAPRP